MNAQQRAKSIVDDLNERLRNDPVWKPRIWQPAHTTKWCRIYTGSRNEYLTVHDDGRIERSQANISWGHVIDDIFEQE